MLESKYVNAELLLGPASTTLTLPTNLLGHIHSCTGHMHPAGHRMNMPRKTKKALHPAPEPSQATGLFSILGLQDKDASLLWEQIWKDPVTLFLCATSKHNLDKATASGATPVGINSSTWDGRNAACFHNGCQQSPTDTGPKPPSHGDW